SNSACRSSSLRRLSEGGRARPPVGEVAPIPLVRDGRGMTLHEAMAVVLRGSGWMDVEELERELAHRELYVRPKDGKPPPAYQLRLRAKNYPHWFEARGPGRQQIRLVP